MELPNYFFHITFVDYYKVKFYFIFVNLVIIIEI